MTHLIFHKADLDGRPLTFRGVYIKEAVVTLPKKWFNFTDNATLQIVGKELLIGSGGISGMISIEPKVFGTDISGQFLTTKIGKWELGFEKFDIAFSHGSVVGSNIKGKLFIPKLKNALDQPAIINISGHLQENGDFQLTASERDGITASIPNLINFTFLSVELGREDDNFYIGAGVILSFPQNSVINKILKGQEIELPRLRMYDDGSIELVGGTSFIPTNISLNLGPIDVDVTGIHLGSHQQSYQGVDRSYNYIGFDGGISLDPIGIDVRGEGVKYYYTTDNGEPILDNNGEPVLDDNGDEIRTKPSHSFLRIQTIEVDMIIPSDATEEKAMAIIKGMLTIPELGESPEFGGSVSFEQPNTGLGGAVDMRFMPRESAFVIDANLSLNKPIPLGGTGLGLYAFRGILGYKYVAEMEVVDLVPGEDTWYDYYIHRERGVNIEKMSRPPLTDDYRTPITLGAGTVLATDADEGYAFSTRLMLILSLPSVFILSGRANIVGDRCKIDDPNEPPFYAGVAMGEASYEFWFGANFKLAKDGPLRGKILTLDAEAQAAYFKNNPSAWYINIGTKEVPNTARIVEIFNAQAYLMLSAQGIEAGARIDFEERKQFGPARIEFKAYIEIGANISFERPQMSGYLALGGSADIDIWIVGFNLELNAILSVEAAKPFLLYAEIRVKACIKFFGKKICRPFTIPLKWEKERDVNLTPIAPLTFIDDAYKQDKSEQLVKGIHMLTNESFDINKLGITAGGNTINESSFAGSINKVIPIDTYIEIKTSKSLDPTTVNNSGSGTMRIGGHTHGADSFMDFIPPDRVVRGGREVRQVIHKYAIKSMVIKALDKAGNWIDYHPFEAVVDQTDRGQFANSPVGYWQKSDKKYNTIRIPSTSPFQYTENGRPGSFTPEVYGITPSDIFCEGLRKGFDCSDFEKLPIGRSWDVPSQFEGHQIDGAFYQLTEETYSVIEPFGFGNFQIITNNNVMIIKPNLSGVSNNSGFNHSLRFSNYTDLEIKIPEPAKKVRLKLGTLSEGATINIYTAGTFLNDQMQYTVLHTEYLTRAEMNANDYEYESTGGLISRIVISPARGDLNQISNAIEQINVYVHNYYENVDSSANQIINNDPGYVSLLDQLNILTRVACAGAKDPEGVGELTSCYTSLYSLCWMSVANFNYNLTVPAISAVEEERVQMVETLRRTAQPIWRPDTTYYIKFTLEDTVNESNTPDTWDYYYGFKTGGPLGFFQDHPQANYVSTATNNEDPYATEDKYAVTNLKQYINYARSYPHANGDLLKSKPMFTDGDQAEIQLFFLKPFVKQMLAGWFSYKETVNGGFEALNGSISFAIKDPVSNEIIPFPFPPINDYTDVPSTVDQWTDDNDPKLPNDIRMLNNIINRINNESNTIRCTLNAGNPIIPVHESLTVTVNDLKPQKLYTALVYNNYAGSGADYDKKKIHEFVFKTSRYGNFSEQVLSYISQDLDINNNPVDRREFVFQIDVSFENEQLELMNRLMAGIIDDRLSRLEMDAAHPFDRLIDVVFKMKPLAPPVSSEFNLIKDEITGNYVAILFRNPEPLNSPNLPADLLSNGIDGLINPSVHVLDGGDKPDPTYTCLHSKDYSQFLITNDSNNISLSNLRMKFGHIKWNGKDYEEKDSVVISNLLIN